MGRIRTIKPEFPQSESVGRLSRDARLLFIQLWTVADDAGRARAAQPLLAGWLYPYDGDVPVEEWLRELETEGMIVRYQVNKTRYLQVCKWEQHQKIDRPTKSRLPEPPACSTNPREHSTRPREHAANSQGHIDAVPRTVDLGSRTVEEESLRAEVGAESAPEPAAAGTLDEPAAIPADDSGGSSRIDDSYRAENQFAPFGPPSVASNSNHPPDDVDDESIHALVRKIRETYPKRGPDSIEQMILLKAEEHGPTLQDGLRYLLERTRMYRAEVESWPLENRRLAYRPEKFFETGIYDQEPEYWTYGLSSPPPLLGRLRATTPKASRSRIVPR